VSKASKTYDVPLGSSSAAAAAAAGDDDVSHLTYKVLANVTNSRQERTHQTSQADVLTDSSILTATSSRMLLLLLQLVLLSLSTTTASAYF